MEKLTKQNLKLVGSSPTLEMLVSMIESKMYWKVISTKESVNYSFGRKKVYEIETTKGVNKNAVIISESGRYKLYFISL